MSFDPRYRPAEIYFQNRSVLLNDENYVYRIREHPDKTNPDYINVMREPYGPNEAGELSDTFYFTPDDGSPSTNKYHEHEHGFELFMVGGEGARCLISIRGRQTFAYPGDVIFIPPFTPHTFQWYGGGHGEPLRWRELFSDMQMNTGAGNSMRILEFAPHARENPEFEALVRGVNGKLRYDYNAIFDDAEDIPEVIRLGRGVAQFHFGGVSMYQKVTRAQWWGQREIWEYRLPRGFRLSCTHWNDKETILMVYSGRLRVRINGVEEFIAKPWDYIDIPQFIGAELTALDDEVILFDYNCTGMLYRAVEEISMRARRGEAILSDPTEIQRVLRKCGVYMTGTPE